MISRALAAASRKSRFGRRLPSAASENSASAVSMVFSSSTQTTSRTDAENQRRRQIITVELISDTM